MLVNLSHPKLEWAIILVWGVTYQADGKYDILFSCTCYRETEREITWPLYDFMYTIKSLFIATLLIVAAQLLSCCIVIIKYLKFPFKINN